MHATSLLLPARYKRGKERERNERRHETRENSMARGRHTSVLFRNKTVYFRHRLCGVERKRDKRGERVYRAAGESVKNRQLHRQKRDAESIHLLGVGRERNQTDSQRKACCCWQRLLTGGRYTKRLKGEMEGSGCIHNEDGERQKGAAVQREERKCNGGEVGELSVVFGTNKPSNMAAGHTHPYTHGFIPLADWSSLLRGVLVCGDLRAVRGFVWTPKWG